MKEIYFEVGQIVWSVTWGKGIVKSINDELYGLKVKFPEIDILYQFTFDGRYVESAEVSLFQTKPEFLPNIPICKFKKGDLVWVSIDNKSWEVRYYSQQNKYYWCFNNQKKEGDISSWQYIKEFKDNPFL